jgi:hypothetical protein
MKMRIHAMHMWHPDARFWQVVMFHGEAVLPPERAGIASHTLDERDIRPMRLIVNGSQLAEVFIPVRSCSLVVSERVMSQLRPLQSNFAFAPVEFAKVYNLPWPRHNATESEIPPIINYYRGREMDISKACPHDEAMAASLPPYYEIVAPKHYELLDVFPSTHQFFMMWYDGEPFESDILPMSKELFRANPITDCGNPVVRDDILDAFSPFLDRRFFGIKEFSFDD